MTKEEKKTLIQGQIESGLSQIEFCKQHNLNVNSFRQWKNSFKRHLEPLRPTFVELIPLQNASSITHITILVGKYRVEIPSHFDKVTLRAILESIPC